MTDQVQARARVDLWAVQDALLLLGQTLTLAGVPPEIAEPLAADGRALRDRIIETRNALYLADMRAARRAA